MTDENVKGKKALLSVKTSVGQKDSPLKFWVKVMGVERSYGKNRYRVVPVSGTGEALVEKITFQE